MKLFIGADKTFQVALSVDLFRCVARITKGRHNFKCTPGIEHHMQPHNERTNQQGMGHLVFTRFVAAEQQKR